jgi:hypothetical protein
VIRRLSILLACLHAVTVAAMAGEGGLEAATITGQAFDLDSGKLLYSEDYFCSPAEDGSATGRCSVVYRDERGDMIARKEIDYSRSLQAPSLLINDYRQARELQMEFTDQPDLVVDAGFDNFVRLNWDQLSEGDPVKFRFLVAGRDSPLKMKARADDSDSCDEETFCLTISLDSWLLGSFVDPIELTYSRDDRRLLRFRGISNIRDAAGATQEVDIRYRYPSSPVAAAD